MRECSVSVCMCLKYIENWATVALPQRIWVSKMVRSQTLWCRLLQCIVMVTFLRKSQRACIVLIKIRRRKIPTHFTCMSCLHLLNALQERLRPPREVTPSKRGYAPHDTSSFSKALHATISLAQHDYPCRHLER